MISGAVGHTRGQGDLNMPYRTSAILSTQLFIGNDGQRGSPEGVHEWIGMRMADDLYLIQRLLLLRLSYHARIQRQCLCQRAPQGLIPRLELPIKVPRGIAFSALINACRSMFF